MKSWLNILLLMLSVNLNAQNLDGTRWQLVSIDDLNSGISKDILSSAKVSLRFECDSIYSGRFCNSFCGIIKFFSDNAIKMQKPITTRMTCMGLDKYEKDMMSVFQNAVKYRVEDDKLFLFSAANKRLTYKRER